MDPDGPAAVPGRLRRFEEDWPPAFRASATKRVVCAEGLSLSLPLALALALSRIYLSLSLSVSLSLSLSLSFSLSLSLPLALGALAPEVSLL